MHPSVLASVVTYNSAEHIVSCVQSLLAQSYVPLTVMITDNASADDSAGLVERSFGPRVQLVRNQENLGFSQAHNNAIRATECSYVLTLNPDAILSEDFVAILVRFLERRPEFGSVSGKLCRMDRTHRPVHSNGRLLLDSTGMEFLPNQRHRDRGAGQEDRGQFDAQEEVFGTTAAAGFYRRAMLEDTALDGQYFDEAFFVYREDVDLAWRAQIHGWRCGFEPRAVGYHVRQGIPERRSLLSAEINYHSAKNRFLLRLKNMPAGMYARHFLAITARDLMVVGYALLREHHSLRAWPYVCRHWRRYRSYRREVARRRRVPWAQIERWVSWRSLHVPLPESSIIDQPGSDGHAIRS